MKFIKILITVCLSVIVVECSVQAKLASQDDILALDQKMVAMQARLNESMNQLKQKIASQELALNETDQRFIQLERKISQLQSDFTNELRKNSSKLQNLELKLDLLDGKKFDTLKAELKKDISSIKEDLKKTSDYLENKIKIILDEIEKSNRKQEIIVEKNLPENGIHIVRPGDTISVIAHKYGMKTEDIIRINHIDDPHKVRIGQEIALVEE